MKFGDLVREIHNSTSDGRIGKIVDNGTPTKTGDTRYLIRWINDDGEESIAYGARRSNLTSSNSVFDDTNRPCSFEGYLRWFKNINGEKRLSGTTVHELDKMFVALSISERQSITTTLNRWDEEKND